MTPSRPQIVALRRVRGSAIFAADVNRGNARRTYASLFKLGLIDWDPIFQHGRVKLTDLGKQTLEAAEIRARTRKGTS